MDKSWIKAKEAEYAIEARNRKSDIIAKINDFELLNEHDKQTLKHMLDKVPSVFQKSINSLPVLM